MAKLAILYPPCPADPQDRGTVLDHRIATELCDVGKVVYELTTGKAGVADATAAGKHTPAGIVMHQKKTAGQAVEIIRKGLVAGYDLSAKNVGTLIFLDTTGDLADVANGTTTVPIGVVVGTTRPNDDGTLQKLLDVFINPTIAY